MTAPVRRAVVMAGGGLKVAYQAGVLQVWLDEAGIDMDLATASSGGTMNLAMWAQGYRGTQIADAWRAYRPFSAVSLDVAGLLTRPFPGLLTRRGLTHRVYRSFGLDWHEIRTMGREALFDVFNFSAQEHQVIEARDLTEDLLASASALPLWFNPVQIGSESYIDAVFATDANLDEAVRRGATELWIVWTVSTAGRWRGGFINGYFQMIEAMANSDLRASLRRIEQSNAAIAAGKPGYHPHRVRVRLIAAEVPLHYLLVFRRDRVRRTVDLGVQDARRWCVERGIPLREQASTAPPDDDRLSFRERMAGRLTIEEERTSACELDLEIEIADIDRFIADPDHVAKVHGSVTCPALGGRLPILSGLFNVLVARKPGDHRMLYEMTVTTPDGRHLRVRGEKFARHDAGLDMWKDTTTLYVTMHDEQDKEIAAGVLQLSVLDFLKQLSSMRATGKRPLAALGRFAGYFIGALADTYLWPAAPRPLPRWLRAAAE
jgi:predicted acylesterase/phospholipase RssA